MKKPFLNFKFLTALTGWADSKKLAHLRFANFLKVYGIMWLILAGLALLNIIAQIFGDQQRRDFFPVFLFLFIAVGFYFFYNKTANILKSMVEEEAKKMGFLKFVNPMAPILYVTTILLIAAIIMNAIMGVFFVLGFLFFVMGIIVTLGLVLLRDDYKLDKFVAMPKKFFKAEDYFFDHIVGPEYIVAFLVILYFVAPFGVSSFILYKHAQAKLN